MTSKSNKNLGTILFGRMVFLFQNMSTSRNTKVRNCKILKIEVKIFFLAVSRRTVCSEKTSDRNNNMKKLLLFGNSIFNQITDLCLQNTRRELTEEDRMRRYLLNPGFFSIKNSCYFTEILFISINR